MAALPPRKNPTPTKISKQHLTPLQILLQMGFPKHRAEKALAATGNRGVQLASDWLLAHVNDPSLDECSPREYILYACPTGPFLQQLESFWAQTRELCGWNGAHNFTPHVTLVSFFKAPDECAPQLSKALKELMTLPGAHINRPIALELYTSPNFMGFFVVEDDANYLKRLALQYVKEVSHSTISLEPHVKSLHLTLAYQFPPNQYNALKQLVENFDTSFTSANWELRLYSRDSRLATKQVHKILYPHTPREPDELELRIGDYIYLSPEAIQSSSDGWVEGISWLTGTNGYLPENYTERTAESDAWTMHRTVPLCDVSPDMDPGSDTVDGLRFDQQTVSVGGTPLDEHDIESQETVSVGKGEIQQHDETQPDGGAAQNKDDSVAAENLYELMKKRTSMSFISAGSNSYDGNETEETRPSQEDATGRRIYVLRHGERIDFTFGTWIPYCFDESGNYIRKDLNMPKSLPQRKSCLWQRDSPLTNMGRYQGRLTGEAMKDAGVRIDHVYSSPSFRCIQTTTAILEGLGLKESHPIHVEPGLFEWLAWYQDGVPEWMSNEELIAADYNVVMDYGSLSKIEDLKEQLQENLEEFYQRNSAVTEHLIQNTSGNILLVGHATTLDTCTRHIVGEKLRSTNDMSRIMQKVPYCSMAVIESEDGADGWKLVEPPCDPITHTNNHRFDWKILL
ncbi:ecdysteroid-phosphate phosphatase isoform X2 [Topomyia yanbarensis]|uniref:ecdysteroid-phosphate phosphatase isoform X2 n=1 Tax=Topomyia yanbarensis TaxID=2498891 RepID=UPI00273B071B|nr:ecdysteroid-phosphate phosphatase isoform X2 [Topomyia yanbarensis]